jgi:hypothetical protein
MIRSVFFQVLIAPLRLVQASPCVLSHDSKGPRPKKNVKHVRGETAPRSKASSRCLRVCSVLEFVGMERDGSVLSTRFRVRLSLRTERSHPSEENIRLIRGTE